MGSSCDKRIQMLEVFDTEEDHHQHVVVVAVASQHTLLEANRRLKHIAVRLLVMKLLIVKEKIGMRTS